MIQDFLSTLTTVQAQFSWVIMLWIEYHCLLLLSHESELLIKILLLFHKPGVSFQRKKGPHKNILDFQFCLIDINLNSVVQIIKRCRYRVSRINFICKLKRIVVLQCIVQQKFSGIWITLRISRYSSYYYHLLPSIDATMCVGINNNFVYIMTSLQYIYIYIHTNHETHVVLPFIYFYLSSFSYPPLFLHLSSSVLFMFFIICLCSQYFTLSRLAFFYQFIHV